MMYKFQACTSREAKAETCWQRLWRGIAYRLALPFRYSLDPPAQADHCPQWLGPPSSSTNQKIKNKDTQQAKLKEAGLKVRFPLLVCV